MDKSNKINLPFLHGLEGTELEFLSHVEEDKPILRLDLLHPLLKGRVSGMLG